MQRAQAENFERRSHPNRPLIAGVRNAVAAGVVLRGKRAERRDETVDDRCGTIEDSACTIDGKVARGGGRLLHTLRAVRAAPRGFMARADRARCAGRLLIERLLAVAEQQGWWRVYWSRVCWMTRESNAVARRLYDRFTPADDFVPYSVTLAARAENDDPADV
jgi:hypothetical protein